MRFKGFNLIGRLPEELWMKVYEIAQEAMIKASQEKQMQKAKWLPEEALKMAQKRREAKGKGEKKKDTHLNAEFQRIAWR